MSTIMSYDKLTPELRKAAVEYLLQDDGWYYTFGEYVMDLYQNIEDDLNDNPNNPYTMHLDFDMFPSGDYSILNLITKTKNGGYYITIDMSKEIPYIYNVQLEVDTYREDYYHSKVDDDFVVEDMDARILDFEYNHAYEDYDGMEDEIYDSETLERALEYRVKLANDLLHAHLNNVKQAARFEGPYDMDAWYQSAAEQLDFKVETDATGKQYIVGTA